jgi:aryl-alcohol dehydrogenase-like predicted oxidoreductase
MVEPVVGGMQRAFHPTLCWIVPIPGTTKLARLEENLGAASVELAAEDLLEIADAAAKITVRGARYPDDLMKLSGR